MEAYNVGHRQFGENKVQELAQKYEMLPKDIEWHFIGHLQRNKIKFIAPFVSLIHGVDSERLLIAINKEGTKNNRVIPCLLQVHIADEDTKYGFSEEEIMTLLTGTEIKSLDNIQIKGLMGMATNTKDKDQVRTEFKSLKTLFENIKNNYSLANMELSEISMGMSSDYQIALHEGSTMVRIGSSVFGAREYKN